MGLRGTTRSRSTVLTLLSVLLVGQDRIGTPHSAA